MLALAAYLLGIGAPETYPRAVMRARAKRLGQTPNIKPAQSGATIPEMFQVTVVEPVKMFFTDPIVTIATIYLGFNFAVVFQWFISVPVVLHLVYNFSVQQAGLAFIAAIVGALLAALMSIMIDRIVSPKQYRKTNNGQVRFEYRLWPAMIGGFLVMTSLFWIGWTASPKVSWQSPVIGTMLFVWGNLSIIVSHPLTLLSKCALLRVPHRLAPSHICSMLTQHVGHFQHLPLPPASDCSWLASCL